MSMTAACAVADVQFGVQRCVNVILKDNWVIH